MNQILLFFSSFLESSILFLSNFSIGIQKTHLLWSHFHHETSLPSLTNFASAVKRVHNGKSKVKTPALKGTAHTNMNMQ